MIAAIVRPTRDAPHRSTPYPPLGFGELERSNAEEDGGRDTDADHQAQDERFADRVRSRRASEQRDRNDRQ